ncbi:14299_t:CDS:2, partial [Funneliformis caledonium]
DLRRWSVDKLRDILNRRNIHFDIISGRNELVNLLKQEIEEEAQIGKESREDFSKMDIDEWAFKCNQKYGKKGSEKRLVKELVAALTHYFMDMLDRLKEMVENGELIAEVIPSLKTIENWITRFSSSSKKEHGERFLEQNIC